MCIFHKRLIEKLFPVYSLLSGNMDIEIALLTVLAVLVKTRGKRLKQIKFQACDTVIFALIPTPIFMGPYHKLFAVSNTELLQLAPRRGHIWETDIKLVDLNYFRFPESWQPAAAVTPDAQRGPIGKKGVILARRIVGLNLPYHTFNCNCYHYADYLTYGRTFGKRWSKYFPIGDTCPLHRRIDTTTNVAVRGFELWDNTGRKFKLNFITLKDLLSL